MSNIDKRALREAAEKASTDNHTQDEWFHYLRCSTPESVLALLDELEAVQKTSAARLGAIDTTHKMFQRERDRAEAAEKRIAELEAKLETSDKLQDSAFRHGLQHGFSLGQTDNQAGFEECLSAYGTRGKDNG